jgi:hypothetical protein
MNRPHSLGTLCDHEHLKYCSAVAVFAVCANPPKARTRVNSRPVDSCL